ncbi:MAG: hypothetical protein HLUCCX14_07165 [Marinobacter excellens HL-55]|uniref:Uncharacterized protein n=1 Tax=Marinobacter excellens HL-55 TaxID=1305731 RepID=A0A0P8B6X6_9GAMM|nr:MAG: hypothetical protein HLUCCX14_07165 [Marinobacter excellens HL-55]
MTLRHKLENALWWFLIDVAPMLILCLVIAVLAYTQGQIDALKLLDSLEVCP